MSESVQEPQRRNGSFLAVQEQIVIRRLCERMPASVSSLQLTAIGMVGAIMACIGLVGCNVSYLFLPVVACGVFLNWFGDSLDGSVARFRNEERPQFGFLVDHTCDLFAQIIMIVAFGLSPFLSLVSSLTVLLCYLVFSAYTYIRAASQYVHQMSYIGLGATEFRILMIVWSCVGAACGLREPLVSGFSTLDVAIGALALGAIVGLAMKAVSDARAVASIERRGPTQADVFGAPPHPQS